VPPEGSQADAETGLPAPSVSRPEGIQGHCPNPECSQYSRPTIGGECGLCGTTLVTEPVTAPRLEEGQTTPRSRVTDASRGLTLATAKHRAQLQLNARLSLTAAEAVAVVKDVVANGVRRTIDVGQHISVSGEDGISGPLVLVISGVLGRKECIFFAGAVPAGGFTGLRVGPLQQYRTTQTRLYGLIPTGPKQIPGYGFYKWFLRSVAAALDAADPLATITIASPGTLPPPIDAEE
jgi:hypothetical protein